MRPTPRGPSRLFLRSLVCAGGAALAAGCFSSGDGTSPPLDTFYFPVGAAMFAGDRFLAVASSDYDLHYSAGSLLVLDLERLRALTPHPCGADDECDPSQRCDTIADGSGRVPSQVCVDRDGANAGNPCGPIAERSVADRLLYPGRCQNIDIVEHGLRTAAVEIGAFATDVLYRERPLSAGDGEIGRLFVPVRGDATVHWLGVTDAGELRCGQDRNDGACDDAHRVGDDPDRENTRDLRLDPEPFAIAASASGEAVVVSNRTTGRVALFVNDWERGPELKHVLTGLPAYPVGLAALPPPAYAWTKVAFSESRIPIESEYAPGFLVTFANAPEVDLVRYFTNGAHPEQPYLTRANRAGILLNSAGFDSRGIDVNDAPRRALENDCRARFSVPPDCSSPGCLDEAFLGQDQANREAYLACLFDVSATPIDVFVANRSPASLLVGRTRPVQNSVQTSEVPDFYDTIPLTLGPSRVISGNVVVGETPEGNLEFERRVFVACFDTRRIFVYDPDRRRLETEITTGRGPHALVVDSNHGLLYVAHFTDSYLGVVSLDRRYPATYGKFLASIGRAIPPRTSK